LIFCLLIAIFIINFRPGQSRQDEGCGVTKNLIVSVDGNEASATAYHIAYSNPYNRETGKHRTAAALEKLIRRELLLQEARARNLNVTTDLVEEEIKKGHFFYGGERLMIPGIFDEDGLWSYEMFKRWVANLNVSQGSYEGEQASSMEAAIVADLLRDQVRVSRDEALAQYLYDYTLVTYDVVAFKPDDFRAAMHVTDADLDRYIAAHAADVEKKFKTDERLYKDLPRQLKLREIFLAKPEEPKAEEPKGSGAGSGSDAGSAAGSGVGSGSAAKPPVVAKGPTLDELKAKVEAARAQIAAGKLKFADAAKELNSDPDLKASGGELGWRSADKPALGEKAASDAIKALKPGEMTPVIAGEKGVYLVIAEEERSGNLTFDQVKHEIALNLAKDDWSKEAAKRAALKALADVQAKKKPDQPDPKLADLFPHENAEPFMPPAKVKQEKRQLINLLRSSQIPDEMRGQFYNQIVELEQFEQVQRAMILGEGVVAGEHGGTAPAGDVVATKDELPKVGDVAVKVVRNGPAPRMVVMPGIGKSKAAADALFDELGPSSLAKKVYEADGKFFVIQLVEKTQPKVDDFDKQATANIAELRQMRAAEMLEDWLKSRCEALVKDSKIKVNPDLVRETDDKGNVLPTQYRPCQSFR
jgi:parvulin-like peptidyl-prolyl isomerase